MFNFYIQDNSHISEVFQDMENVHILDFYMNFYMFLYQ